MNTFMSDAFRDILADFNFEFSSTKVYHVSKTENGKRLEIVAPGLAKEQFKVRHDKNIGYLIISHPGKRLNELQSSAMKFPELNLKFSIIGLTVSGVNYVDGILVIDLVDDIKQEEFIEVK